MRADQITITVDQRQRLLGGGVSAYRPQDLAHWSGLKLTQFRMPETISDRHVVGLHPILSMVREGRGQSRLRYGRQDVSTSVQVGDLMCYRGGMEIECAEWRTQNAVLLSVEIDPARLLQCESGDGRFAPATLVGAPRFNDARLSLLMSSLWDEVAAGCPRGRLHADSLSLGLAGHVYARFGGLAEDRREAAARLSATQLRHVNDFILAHLGASFGLQDMAQAAGLSRFHFARVFRNTVGCSPHQHVLQQRVQQARRLLVGTTLPMSEIALSCGFASQSHFSDTCRRLLGSTPSAVRLGGSVQPG